jgi:Tfp pilus assembly protein PilV
MIARAKSESGLTLIETVIAVSMLLVAMIGLLSMAALATVYTENHGHLEARTTEYAQDKMEQLLAIAFTDSVTDTTQFPAIAAPTTGSGLAVGGSVDPAAPVDKYVDWLAYNGNLKGGGTTQPDDWYYERVWHICYVQPAGTCDTATATELKQITVVTTVRTSVGRAIIPKSTVSALKASQF